MGMADILHKNNFEEQKFIFSEVQSMVGQLHCSWPDVRERIMAKEAGRRKLLSYKSQEVERELLSPGAKYKPQMHAPSDLLPPVMPYLPTVTS